MAGNDRAERLAAQLRANLRKRKAQARSVTDTGAAGEPADGDQRQGSIAAAAAQAPLAE